MGEEHSGQARKVKRAIEQQDNKSGLRSFRSGRRVKGARELKRV